MWLLERFYPLTGDREITVARLPWDQDSTQHHHVTEVSWQLQRNYNQAIQFELAAEADETINFILRTQINMPREPAKKRKLLPAELENKKSIE